MGTNLTPTVDPSELGFDPDRLERIGAHFRTYVDDGRLPGWAIAVSRRGEIVYHDAYGKRDVAADKPIEDDTIYRFFSMTKPMTSVAIMMLLEEGLVSLDDPVSKYIPSFADQRVFSSG